MKKEKLADLINDYVQENYDGVEEVTKEHIIATRASVNQKEQGAPVYLILVNYLDEKCPLPAFTGHIYEGLRDFDRDDINISKSRFEWYDIFSS